MYIVILIDPHAATPTAVVGNTVYGPFSSPSVAEDWINQHRSDLASWDTTVRPIMDAVWRPTIKPDLAPHDQRGPYRKDR